ncbi:hypothetical protein H0H92_005143 [Tricholoma furcatifolium]|nr:hypothetical protein H0H92_005143 [Tricholoma furcatifolium]
MKYFVVALAALIGASAVQAAALAAPPMANGTDPIGICLLHCVPADYECPEGLTLKGGGDCYFCCTELEMPPGNPGSWPSKA